MSLRAVLATLPAGYLVRRDARGVLAIAADAEAEFARQGFSLAGDERLPASGLAGREALGELLLGAGRCVVRRFQHGGLRRAFLREHFFEPARPFHELVLAERLRAAGFATPRVLAARALRSGFAWRLALVSARAAGEDAGKLLERWRRGELARGSGRALCAAVGALVGRLHGAGFLHADLHPRNLLVAPDGSLALLDLDKSRFQAALSPALRRTNLRRLYRSVRRRERRGEHFLARGDYLAFLRAYAGACGTDWRADWRAIERADRLHAPWHRLGWGLERVFGDGPERREG
jgi:3-deoxy-D-manno-octulosonic acid kinase